MAENFNRYGMPFFVNEGPVGYRALVRSALPHLQRASELMTALGYGQVKSKDCQLERELAEELVLAQWHRRFFDALWDTSVMSWN